MFREFLNNNIVLLDGAMGTALIDSGLKQGDLPERLNFTHPELITNIHKSYINSGSKVVYCNTFGANRLKFTDKSELELVIKSAIKNARKACGNDNFVALDIGPTGELIEPLGELSFEESYDIFKEIILIASNEVDLIVFETFSNLYELKSGLLAARENSNLPVIATMTFEENMRTFTGCLPSSFALTVSPFADAIGINCSLGPKQILPIMQELKKWTNLPLVLKANAGLPDSSGNYGIGAKEFSETCEDFLNVGVRLIGGCCGTTPAHINALNNVIKNYKFLLADNNNLNKSFVCSQTNTVEVVGAQIVGERLNPTGKKAMRLALIEGDYDYLTSQAVEQASAGAEILDINVGVPELDEASVMADVVKKIQSVSSLPFCIDSKSPKAIESGLRVYCGKAIVNSISGEEKIMEEILPIVKKYGASVIGLTIDENGIPDTWEKRIEIAKKIIAKCNSYGIKNHDIYIDCLTLTISTEQNQVKHTLKAITEVKKLGCRTILGVSNISFGLPERQNVNSVFLTLALSAGLDLAILNPNIKANTDVINSFKAVAGTDKNCISYVKKYSIATSESADLSKPNSLEYSVLNGLSSSAAITEKLLIDNKPLDIINNILMPSLDKVGAMFESGKLFLPQLIASAESAKESFAVINKAMSSSEKSYKGTIILATVKGDIHDIGKNIVKVLLENYGFKVIDLGKNVDKSVICDRAEKDKVKLVGLSALMTTTAENMKETILEIKKRKLDCKVMVGGAAITQEYADFIGADFYGKDANQSVKYANTVFSAQAKLTEFIV